MDSRSTMITVPNVSLTLDQLLVAVRQLDGTARTRVAQALLETEMDDRLATLIGRLAARSPADDITDDDINAEIQAVRKMRAGRQNAENSN